MGPAVQYLMFILPIILFGWFLTSLILFIVFKNKNKTNPGLVPQGRITLFLVMTIVSGALLLGMVLTFMAIFGIMLLVVASM